MLTHLRRAAANLVLAGAVLAAGAPLAVAAPRGVTAQLSAGKLQITGGALNDTVTVRLSPTNTLDVHAEPAALPTSGSEGRRSPAS